MASATTSFERNSEFDSFLFASLGEERNGMSLSVLSAIARLDVDPWHEAASLRGMPARAATERLMLLISSLPNVQPMPLAPATIARLIGLLAQKARDPLLFARGAVPRRGARRWPLVLYFIFAIVTIGAQHTANKPDAKAPAGNGSAPSASVVDPVVTKIRGE